MKLCSYSKQCNSTSKCKMKDSKKVKCPVEGMKFDKDKPDWSLFLFKEAEAVTRVLGMGAKKYDRENWKNVQDAHNRYFAAMIRHLVKYHSGEKIDEESNESHLAHVICNALFLMWFDNE